MALIDYTYYYSNTLIVGLGCNSEAEIAKTTEVESFSARYEKKFLRAVLGDDLYDAFIAGFTGTPAAKWTALANQLRDATAKTSPIANYVWYKWQQQNQQLSTATGDKTATELNLVRSSNYGKYVNVWNAMCEQLDDFYEWLNDNTATYTEWDGTTWEYDTINQFGI